MTSTELEKPASFPPVLSSLRIELSVRIGTAVRTVGELRELKTGALIALDESAERPLELLANGRVIARGELEETEDGQGLALHITETIGMDGPCYG
jgi:flagellar motor switch protein FliN/FliY